MTKEYTFSTRHYPVNDLLELDLEEHLNQMGRIGWELVSTQPLVMEHSSASPKMIFFWGRDR